MLKEQERGDFSLRIFLTSFNLCGGNKEEICLLYNICKLRIVHCFTLSDILRRVIGLNQLIDLAIMPIWINSSIFFLVQSIFENGYSNNTFGVTYDINFFRDFSQLSFGLFTHTKKKKTFISINQDKLIHLAKMDGD